VLEKEKWPTSLVDSPIHRTSRNPADHHSSPSATGRCDQDTTRCTTNA
jgi:hypothetical protein